VGTLWVSGTVVALLCGSLIGIAATSSATAPQPLTVSATASPASGTTVDPGAVVTYTLNAKSQQPLPDGATVVDDLSGLLPNATVTTTPGDLAKQGLTLDTNTRQLNWTVPPLGAPGTASSTATTSFQATVAPAARGGARLATSAALQGSSCVAGGPCATTLTVADPTPATTTSTTQPGPKSATSTTTSATAPVDANPAPAAPASPSNSDAPQAGQCTQPQAPNATVVAGFEIDGNLCVNAPGNLDWSNVGGQPVDDDGFDDNTQFTRGASENDWPWTTAQISGSGSTPASADIGNVYAFTHVVNNQVYAYFGFERDAGTGSVAYWIELNQLPNRFGPVSNRTTGDLRLTLFQNGNAPIALDGAATWLSSGPNTGAWVSLPSLAGFAGATNTVSGVTNLSGTQLAPYTFAEVAVNLSTLFATARGVCSGNYRTFNLRSSSSTNENASLGDWIQPVDLGVPSTCASVLVNKSWNIDGTTYANGSQPPGFTASLSLTGQTNPQFGVTYERRSDGGDYLAGDPVTVGESVSVPAGCTNIPNGDVGDHTLTPGLNTFQITNVVTCTRLTLQKAVVGGSASPEQWTLSAAGPTPGISGPTGSPPVTGVRVEPGTYTLTESGGPSAYQQTSLTCSGAVLTGNAVTVDLHANVTCTFTNTATHPVVLTKVWRSPIPGDTVSLEIHDGSNLASGSSTAPSTTTDATLTTLTGDTVTLTEAFTVGSAANYMSTLACDNGVTPAPATGTSGSFVVPDTLAAGTTIMCAFANSRAHATLVLQKTWVNGAAGDTAHLSISGTDPTISATATSMAAGAAGSQTDTTHQATASIFAGQTVTVSEALGAANTGTYTSAFSCTNGTTGTGNTGTFTVPSPAVNVTCTFTNTRTQAKLTLEKSWVDGAFGDEASLSITGTDPGSAGSAIATVPVGGSGTSSETATAPIFSGGTVTVTEELPPEGHTNTGAYTSDIACTPSTGFTPGAGGQGGTVVVPPAPVDVTCTITNTRTATGVLTLVKNWVNGEPGDMADLTVTGTLASGSALALVPSDGTGLSADRVLDLPITAGEKLKLAETLGASNTGSYMSVLTCNQSGLVEHPDGSYTFKVSSDLEPVLCVFTNTRTSATLTLHKGWVNGATGDQAALSITGSDPATSGSALATVPPGGTGLSSQTATAPIFSGGTVTVSETLGSTNTGDYTSTLDCTDGTTATGRTGTIAVPAVPVDVSCTFTNTRTSATLTLHKGWVNGATGDQAGLSITGTDPATSRTATATVPPGGNGTSSQSASATIYSGQTIVVSEDLPPAGHTNTGTYSSELSCDNGTGGPGTSGTFTVPAAPSDVTCTFANTRTSATLMLQKEWLNAFSGDQADLSITGTDPSTSGAATSTALGGPGSEIDVRNRAVATIYSGQTLTLSEILSGDNVGTYSSSLNCNGTTTTGTTGSFTVPSTPSNALCTFTNSRIPATVELTKTWVNPMTGDQVSLSVTDGTRFGVGSSIAPATTNNASLGVFAGDTINLGESFLQGAADNYTTTLACDNDVSVTDGSFVVPGTLPSGVTILCTFTNTRNQSMLTLEKTWENGVHGDTAGLSITGTDLGTSEASTSTAVATVPSGGSGTSSEKATAPIFSGETVTVNEDLPPAGSTNLGAYTSTIACKPSSGFTPGQGGQGGTLVVPPAPVHVRCTITNTRSSTGELTLQKEWVNGFPGDSADLSATGTLASGTATAVVPDLGTGTSVDKVIVPITQAENVSLQEILGAANVGAYATTLTCNQPGLTASTDGRSGTFAVTSDTEVVLCVFTNSAPPPEPIVAKTVTSSIQNPDGTWTIVYDVAVTNPDSARPTSFMLSDSLAFGAIITVNSASVTGTGANPSWNGTTTTNIVTDAPLGPGAVEHYTVTVSATVLAEATAADRTCAAGGGFLNTAQVSLPGSSSVLEAVACADPGSPTITKNVVSVVAGHAPGQWVVTYDVTVTNGTNAQLSYSLHDPLGFPAGVTITSTSASGVHSALDGSGATAPQVIPGWTGTGTGTVLATNQTIAPQSKDTYTIVVGATVPASVSPDSLACSAAGAGHGFFNSATLTSGVDRFNAEACESVMPTPNPPVSPTAPSPAVTAPSGVLAFTGLLLGHYLLAAAALVVVGAACVLVARRRRSRGRHAMHRA
jgi:hypothetical protein